MTKRLSQIIAGVLALSMLTASVAMAAPLTHFDDAEPGKGPIYQIVDRVLEHKIDKSAEEVRELIENRELKSTLEAEGYDVDAMQDEIRDRVAGVLEARGVSFTIEHTDKGVQLNLYAENEKFLARAGILSARADYFNAVHAPELDFTVKAGTTEGGLTVELVGNDQDAIDGLQYRFPTYN